jgi:hypothetical protein
VSYKGLVYPVCEFVMDEPFDWLTSISVDFLGYQKNHFQNKTINVDAALLPPSSWMGIGVVIRNQIGTCSGAEGFDKLIVALDCLSLVQRANNSEVDLSQIWVVVEVDLSQVGVVVQDIMKLGSKFVWVSFIHVYHHCTVTAHT